MSENYIFKDSFIDDLDFAKKMLVMKPSLTVLKSNFNCSILQVNCFDW